MRPDSRHRARWVPLREPYIDEPRDETHGTNGVSEVFAHSPVSASPNESSRDVADTSISTTVRRRYGRLRRDRHLALRACLSVPSDLHCLTSGVLAVRRRHDPKDARCLTGVSEDSAGSLALRYISKPGELFLSLLLSLLLCLGICLCLPLSCSCSEKMLLSAENVMCAGCGLLKKCKNAVGQESYTQKPRGQGLQVLDSEEFCDVAQVLLYIFAAPPSTCGVLTNMQRKSSIGFL